MPPGSNDSSVGRVSDEGGGSEVEETESASKIAASEVLPARVRSPVILAARAAAASGTSGETHEIGCGGVGSAAWDWITLVDAHLTNGAPLLSLRRRESPRALQLQQRGHQAGSGASGNEKEATPTTTRDNSAFGMLSAFFS